MIADLDPEQREVATTLTGPVVVLAGAGTGKTRAITHRLAYGVLSGVYQPGHVLALTFTARAAGEMRTRLRGLGVPAVQARTFHAAALRQLQYFWPQAVGGAPPPLIDHKAPLVGEAAGRLRLGADRTLVRDLSAEIEWAKVNLLSADRYPAAATAAGRRGVGPLGLDVVARAMRTYEEIKSDRGVIDFEDALLVMLGLLRESPSVASAVRAQYRHFIVDEYQDVSALQQALLDAWLGDSRELCVVGDPGQTIYTFAGASPRHLLDFAARYKGARSLQLVRDYRSTPQIVTAANRLLDSAPPSHRNRRVELIAQRPAGPAPQVRGYPDHLAEAAAVVTEIGQFIARGAPADEICVLYRTNAQSEPLEAELSAAGIAYQVRGGDRFFARPEVRRAVMLLRGAARSATPGTALSATVRDVLSGAGWAAEPPPSPGAARDQWESLHALALLADDLSGSAPPQDVLGYFVAELDQRASAAHAPSAGGVTLSSLHAAKGLEWDVVVIVGCSEGLLPISFADTPDAVEEERRLLYVGITRARRELLLTWSSGRAGARSARSASRFLQAVVPGGAASRTGTSGTAGRAPADDSRAVLAGRSKRKRVSTLHSTCRGCGGALSDAAERKTGRCRDCPPDYDTALLERLRTWRAALASQSRKPAFVIFTDSTLEAIAYAKPTDRAGLLQISGVGAAKLDAYGEAVLAVVAGRDAATG